MTTTDCGEGGQRGAGRDLPVMKWLTLHTVKV